MKMPSNTALLVLFAIAIALTGCSEKRASEERAGSEKPVSAHETDPHGSNPHGGANPADPHAPAGATAANVKFTAPDGWVAEKPSSSMRQAQYKLPRVAGDPEDAEMVVFYFQGGGGGVQANIDRWIGQFTKADGSPATGQAKIDRGESHGIPLTTVDVSGTYLASSGAMMDGAVKKENFRMLAAVAETSAGPWFFRLTGPAKTVAKWAPSYRQFLDSIQ
jgi:hypothetical protein